MAGQDVSVPEPELKPEFKFSRKAMAFIALAGIAVVAAGVWGAWILSKTDDLPDGIVSTNGRIEANRVEIATKIAGRVLDVIPHEGDMVEIGTVVARLDPAEMEAQLRQAEAEAQRARNGTATATAVLASRRSEVTLGEQQLDRTATLAAQGYETREKLDQRRQQITNFQAAETAAEAQVDEASSAVRAADAHVDQARTILDDAIIASPAHGRVQYRLIEPGAVLAAGGRVLTLVDLQDVYMTVFLPAGEAARLSIGDESRIVLDAAPQYVLPVIVSFVAAEAQFTPKTVETSSEREKLMFRIKLQLGRALLQANEDRVKSGLRGVAYLRVDPAAIWPDHLAVKLPQ